MSGKWMFEYVEGSSSKFWEVWADGGSVFTRFGKIGAAGQTKVKDAGDAASAKATLETLDSKHVAPDFYFRYVATVE